MVRALITSSRCAKKYFMKSSGAIRKSIYKRNDDFALHFTVQHMKVGDRELSIDTYYDAFRKEISGCGKVGSSSYRN